MAKILTDNWHLYPPPPNQTPHERYVLSFSENVLIDWVSLMSFGSSLQFLAAENLKAFLAILVLTIGSINLCFALLVPRLWMSLDIVNIALM